MKAIVLTAFGGAENFEEQEITKPSVSDDGLLVAIKATAFNPIDYQMRRGDDESKLLRSPVLGREFSGIVEEVGAGVNGFKPGDEMAAYAGSLGSNGTYAEYINVPAALAAHKPENLSFAEAAALPMAGMTALQAYKRINAKVNDRIFINGGAGGVGSMLIKFLLRGGYKNIVTTAGNEGSAKQLIEIGVPPERILNYKDPKFIDNLFSVNKGEPFDCCIDLVGGAMSEICSQVIKVHGTYVDITHLATAKAREELFDKATTIVNVTNYAYTLTGNSEDLAYYGKSLNEMFSMIEEGSITPYKVMNMGKLSVKTVRDAHTILEENTTKGRKIVMVHE